MKDDKITADDIIAWNGGNEDYLASYLASILNRETSLETAKSEILNYIKDN